MKALSIVLAFIVSGLLMFALSLDAQVKRLKTELREAENTARINEESIEAQRKDFDSAIASCYKDYQKLEAQFTTYRRATADRAKPLTVIRNATCAITQPSLAIEQLNTLDN